MATMTHRTSFALDERTMDRIKKLAARWNVSQAEVVRRSVERADQAFAPEIPDPVAMLRELFAKGGGIDPEVAETYLAQVYEDRKNWRSE